MSCIDLSCIQSCVTASLSGTAIILAPGYASDGMGGGTATYSPVGTAACLVAQTGKTTERVVGEQVLSLPSFQILLPAGTLVQANYRIQSSGWIYEISGHNHGVTLPIFTDLDCVRVGDA